MPGGLGYALQVLARARATNDAPHVGERGEPRPTPQGVGEEADAKFRPGRDVCPRCGGAFDTTYRDTTCWDLFVEEAIAS